MTFPLEVNALKVEQPIGIFYVAVLPVKVLLQVAYSHVMSASLNDDGVSYTLDGTQRVINKNRIPQISEYIDRFDSTFPNSIILAANFPKNQDVAELDATIESGDNIEAKDFWLVTDATDGSARLTIPSARKLAAIIDGQHRLFAFTKVENKERLNMQLVCAIFVDLPKPFQAQIFATINSNQKAVDKSLTYELFGYNISEEEPEYWTPDKLAVFISRRLSVEPGSPLEGKIIVAPKQDDNLSELTSKAKWRVSTAVIVEGIIRLISTNAKRDSNAMLTPAQQLRSILREGTKDKSPLREVYINVNDKLLYLIVKNYLSACEDIFWANAKDGSFILKTVGIQALLDILRKVSADAYAQKNISVDHFKARLSAAGDIDFSGSHFINASGSGRVAIRRAIEEKIGL